MDLLDKFEKFKSWRLFKTEYSLNHTFYFHWLQLTNAWKYIARNNINNNGSPTIKDHHIIRRTRKVSINKLNCERIILKFDFKYRK